GVLQRHTGERAPAAETFCEASEHFGFHGNRLGQAMARGAAAEASPKPAKAERVRALREAALVAEELGNPWFEAEAWLCLTDLADSASDKAESLARAQVRLGGLDVPGLGQNAGTRPWLLRANLPGLAPETPSAAQPLDALRLSFLGDFRVQSRGRVILESDWPTRKAMKLFALLSHVRGSSYSDAVLMERFWPEVPDERSRANLRNALHQIRSLLRELGLPAGEEVIQRSRKAGTVVLRLDYRSDLEDFEAGVMEAAGLLARGLHADAVGPLRGALVLYRSGFLESFEDDWTQGLRAHVTELYLRAQHQLARCCLVLGDAPGAEAAARTALEKDDLREELHVDLIEALVNQGRRADGLRHYRDTLEHFEKELGVIPRGLDSVYPLLIGV
ncbi:MAG: BTAD domain-containing putative transcriptional regulator, partial [Candidatus Eremiobacterota bacterium]